MGTILERIADGRTDLVFDHLSAGHPARGTDANGVSLIKWCAYYGDVSAIRFLLTQGESLESLGKNFDLHGAAFHGHWRLCQFLIEKGANVNQPLPESGETPLHAALCKAYSLAHHHVVRVLLAAGADPQAVSKDGAPAGSFMRDCRTKGETPLHRAAAFGSEESIQLLLEAGARLDVKDAHGDSPLAWASWHLRPVSILRQLCYGDFRIHPDHAGLEAHLLGQPHRPAGGSEV